MVINAITETTYDIEGDPWNEVLAVCHSQDAAIEFVKNRRNEIVKQHFDDGYEIVREDWEDDPHCVELLFSKKFGHRVLEDYIELSVDTVEELD